MGASAAVGGLVLSNCANSVKKAVASMALTCSRVEVLVSTLGSTLPGGGV